MGIEPTVVVLRILNVNDCFIMKVKVVDLLVVLI